MQAEIYADVVFAVNFFMDFFVLYATGKICGKRTVLWRLASAALLGAVLYCLLLFLPALFPYYNFFTVVCFVFLPTVYAAFVPKTLKEYALIAIASFISASVVGGGALALFYLINSRNSSIFGGSASAPQFALNKFSIYILAAASLLSYFCMKLVQAALGRLSMTKQSFCTVRVFYDNMCAELRALVDTGNTLIEPVSKTPVVIAEFSGIQKCLPPYVRQLFDENKQDDLEAVIACAGGTPFALRLRLIPFQSVGAKNVLVGFRPDKIEIHTDKSVFCKNAVIGICCINLTNDKQYNALINPSLINGFDYG